jgi:Heterokaryon incompatibility protein (HET)
VRQIFKCALRQALVEDDSPLYKYDRLNWANNEIRLIEILPYEKQDGNSENSPVRCSIIQASLRDIPGYIALSYAWGDNTKNKTILLNGRRMEITTSLDVALRHLRSAETKGHNFGSRRIWVDAISINQQDELEKTWQVMQMSRIFKKAEYTLVWQ